VLQRRRARIRVHSRAVRDDENRGFIFRSHSDEKTSNAERSASNGESNHLLAALAAATILSKRGSPRKESQHGLNLRSPYVTPAGIVVTISSCSSARSRSGFCEELEGIQCHFSSQSF
jgi:hypothetical protein